MYGQEWYGAVILKWADNRALIHYLGWQTMWNEWFSPEDMLKRTRPLTATPRFGILSTKDERNRIKRCMNLADELWGEHAFDASGHRGDGDEEDENVDSEVGSTRENRIGQETKDGDSGAGSDEGGSPAAGDSVTAEGCDRPATDHRDHDNLQREENSAADRQALLDFLESVYAQDARIDTGREIEKSAAAARDTEETPQRIDASHVAQSDSEESDESDEDSGVSETESDEEGQPTFSTGPRASDTGLARHVEVGPGPDLTAAGLAGDVASSGGMVHALAASDQHSFLHSSTHAFNGAIGALDNELVALGLELYPAGWGKEKELERESVRAERVAAANRKAVERFRPSDLALLFNRGLCHHYSRHYLEAEADFDLVLHSSARDVE